jgi:hypothetical protein
MTDQEILGTIGEIYYQALFGGLLSEYKYDGEKDLVQADGKQVEIKVQSRYRHSNAFTVNKSYGNGNNLKKCLYVDRLIFIEYSLSDTILIWECVDRRSVFSSTMDDGRVMACWPIDKMVLLKSVKHPKLAEIMRNFSKSETLGWFE